MKKYLLIFTGIILILLLLSQVDDDLAPAASQLIERVEQQVDSPSYLYLSGIFAHPTKDPSSIGAQLLAQSRKKEADADYTVVQYAQDRKIPLPQGPAFCAIKQDDCLKYLFSSSINSQQLEDTHHVLIERFDRFLQFNEFNSLTKPIISEQIPPYQYISAAIRLNIISALSLYKKGESTAAIDALLQQFSSLRHSMALQDTLIGKVFFLTKAASVLDIASIILNKEQMRTPALARLNQTEKDFTMLIAREFALTYYTYKALDRAPNFFQQDGKLPGWIARALFKPNMTINATVGSFTRLAYLSQLSATQFAQEISQNTNTEQPPTSSSIRNYAGSVLLSIASPNYAKYIARFLNMDLKIALFNQQHSDDAQSIEGYYKNDGPYKTANSLCYKGPFTDLSALRCLRVSI